MDWTGGLDWWTKSLLCSLVRPHSPVGLAMMHFSLYKPGHTNYSVCVDVKEITSIPDSLSSIVEEVASFPVPPKLFH